MPFDAGKILTLELYSRAVLGSYMGEHGNGAGWELSVEDVEEQSKLKGPHKYRLKQGHDQHGMCDLTQVQALT